MREKAGSIRFMAATVILVSVAAFSFAGTVMCRAGLGRAEQEGYYREKEMELVYSTRAYLKQQGFENSGVTLTRVVDGDGSRAYTVTVHHRQIDRMEEAGRELLARELAALAFEEEGSTFCYEFLITGGVSAQTGH